MKNRFLLIIGFILQGIKTSIKAQVLSAGAVAFISYQGDSPMAFSLVTTDPIPPFTQISRRICWDICSRWKNLN